MTTITPVSVAKTTAQVETKTPKKADNATITFQEWWNGEKSLTSTGARMIGLDSFADWLEDKDKVCTDGKDDGNIGFAEGAKSFTKGLLGGIPKAIIQHPLVSGAAFAVGAGLLFATGGAAAPLLWGVGALATAATAGTNIYKAATAETDGEMKAALEGTGTAAQSAVLLGATYGTTMNAAKAAGVNTEGNIAQTMKSSAEVSARNANANYETWTTGVVQPNSNIGRIQEQALTEAKELVDKSEYWYLHDESLKKAPSIIKRAGVKIEKSQVVGYHDSPYRDEFSGHIYGTTATRNGKTIYVETIDCGDNYNYGPRLISKIFNALINGDL